MRSRQELERNARREAIIDATEELLNEKTLDEITIEDIAERSDFAKGSIYQYVKNKEELIYAVFARTLDYECRSIEEKCSSQPDPIQAIRNYIKLEFDFVNRFPWVSKVRAAPPLKGLPLVDRLRVLNDRRKQLITDIVLRGQADGLFIEADPHVLTNVILSAGVGFADYFMRINTVLNMEIPEGEMFISIIIKGITKER